MKSVKKIRKFIWSIFLLIISLILLSLGYFKIALFILFIVFLGFIIKIYMLKKEIKLLSKEWANIYVLVMILGLIIWTIVSKYKWTLINIVFCGIVLIGFYLFYRAFPKIIQKEMKKN